MTRRQPAVPRTWLEDARRHLRCTVSRTSEGAVAAGVGPAARTELPARAGTGFARLLSGPRSSGRGRPLLSPPSTLPSVPPRGVAHLACRDSRGGPGPDSSSPAPWPWHPHLPPPTQASELRVPGGWAERGGCGLPPRFPPPPGRLLAGVQLPAGLGTWVSLPAPLPILFCLFPLSTEAEVA